MKVNVTPVKVTEEYGRSTEEAMEVCSEIVKAVLDMEINYRVQSSWAVGWLW